MYQVFCSFPDRPELHNRTHVIISIMLPFSIKSTLLWKELLMIFGDIWFAITLGFYFTNIFTPGLVSTILHPIAILFVVCLKAEDRTIDKCLYITALVSLLDIWNQ